MQEKLQKLLQFLVSRGSRYADARYEEHVEQELLVENGVLKSTTYVTHSGVGIRVLYGNGWGFAATDEKGETALEKTALKALEIAQSSDRRAKKPVLLAPEPVHKATFRSPAAIDPFQISDKEKIDLLKQVTLKAKQVEGVVRATGSMRFKKIRKLFVSTEGSIIEQEITISGAGIAAQAVGEGGFQTRSYPASFGGDHSTRGWEFVLDMNLIENAERIAQEAVQLVSAPTIEPGEYDIVISGNQLALQIHESCGHPSELDRVMGSELSFAGGSFLTPDKLNNFKYGSEHINITADATIPGGLGSFGFDDEGVEAQRTYIVKEGIFVGYLMDRQTATELGLRSNGAARADSWSHLPIIRMTNINLLPGKYTLEELISGIDYGFLLDTNKSWSIDDLRLNFQFATEIAYEIKSGRLTGRIFKNPVYYDITPMFWNKCDGVANEKYWRVWGVPNCGKGQPMQVMHVGHGASYARFRRVKVGVKG
ncbi:TldD/PmbA family protein [Pseudothermotoga thermarum]|uniref:Peptidase U62 modulator of DNA gyrase n=1 Tax=Pseudothermotoga thermarum DSM 5069 TaxID=688269 RepID=F7YWK5_9THEM|nr:TldD/PmbA family protein [Pseudothermotoga thermarum]AEH51986.1 peptidase U62 modulator of DNA gyrase [Pseudothermotoga thermarum DSM 5069]